MLSIENFHLASQLMTPPHILEFAIFHLAAQLSARAIRFRQLSDLLVDQTIARECVENKAIGICVRKTLGCSPRPIFLSECVSEEHLLVGALGERSHGEKAHSAAVRYAPARPLFISLSAPISKQNASEARRQITDLATRRAFIGPLLRKFIAYPRYIESKHRNERLRCVPTRASYWI